MPALKNLNKEMKINQHMHNGSPTRREERKKGRKNIERNNGQKIFPKFDGKDSSTHLKTQQTPSEINSKATHTEIHHSQTV